MATKTKKLPPWLAKKAEKPAKGGKAKPKSKGGKC